MFGSFWKRRQKILRALTRTVTHRESPPRLPNTWWDDFFYGREISDAKTISSSTSQVVAMYHYASVKLKILRHFANNPPASLDRVLDIGTGAGHWLNFYRELGATLCVGIDVSAKCAAALKSKYRNDATVDILQGSVSDLSKDELIVQFAVVNAIGVMFHIVDDDEWTHSIQRIGDSIGPNGIFIASGHFGLLNNLNVQVNKMGCINKRLRSRSCWRQQLRAVGFKSVNYYRNYSYLSIREPQPENNVMIACK